MDDLKLEHANLNCCVEQAVCVSIVVNMTVRNFDS